MMNYKSLKLHTLGSIFTIVLLSTTAVTIVVAVFWYEHLIKITIGDISSQLSLHFQSSQQHTAYETTTFLKKIIESQDSIIKDIVCQNMRVSVDSSKKISSIRLDRDTSFTPAAPEFQAQGNRESFFFNFHRYIPIRIKKTPASPDIYLGITINTAPLASSIWSKWKIIFLYILFNTAVFTTILFFRFRNSLFQPIDNLLNMADNYQLHEGMWAAQSQKSGEFDILSQAMNSMTRRIERDRDKLIETVNQLKAKNKELELAQKATMHAEQLAATGRLAAGFAHEIGNPVTIIQGYLELLEQNTSTENDKKEFIARSLKELQRIDALLFELMNLARTRNTVPQKISPAAICSEIISSLKTTFEKNDIKIVFKDVSNAAAVFCDPEQLRQILLNLFLNAIDAIRDTENKEDGQIQCLVKEQDIDNSRYLSLSITDNGSGIQEEDKKNIFDPFFTTKPVGQGTGLGLSIVYRLVEELQGEIEVTDNIPEGSIFTIRIPEAPVPNET